MLLLDDHELAAGKLAALVARTASRDVFDAREMLRRGGLDRDKLRLGFVVYGGLNRVDWRAITLENVHTTAEDVDAQLAPMLREDICPKKGGIEEWTKTLIHETRDLMAAVLPRDRGGGRSAALTGSVYPRRHRACEPALSALKQWRTGLQWLGAPRDHVCGVRPGLMKRGGECGNATAASHETGHALRRGCVCSGDRKLRVH